MPQALLQPFEKGIEMNQIINKHYLIMQSRLRLTIVAALLCLPLCGLSQPGCNISLPYSTGFESDVSNQAPSCWTTLSGEAYAFNFIYYAHTGSQMLALNSASGEARIATPRIPAPLNQVGVNLWHVDLAWTSAGVLRVGFATSPTGTVQWLDTLPYQDDWTYLELDFSGLSITDTGYLVFSYNNTSGSGSGLIDDMTIYRLSSCSPVTNVHLSSVTNNEATIAWNGNPGAVGYLCYIADTNSRQAAFDSVFVPSRLTECTFSSLTGSSQYYAWVVSHCGDAYSMETAVGFRTNPDCGEVRNVSVVAGFGVLGLSWDDPYAGEEVTGYRVDYKQGSDTVWTSATTMGRYFFMTGLTPDCRYDYRISTFCSEDTGMAVTGFVHTLGCTETVIDSTRSHASLPISYSSSNSYTQQIYLASELNGIDTITGVTFFLANDYNIDTTPLQVWLGNTSKNQFSSGTDYVAVAHLTSVFEGNVSNTGREVTIHFSTPFVRMADSNLVVAVDNNLGDFASTTPSFVVGNGSYRAIYRTSIGDVNPASPGYGSRANYVNRVRFGTTGCTLPQCDSPVVCVAEVGDDYIDVVWSEDSTALYDCAYRQQGSNVWIAADSGLTGGAYHFGNLEPGHGYELRVSRMCGTELLEGAVSAMLPCNPVGVPYVENFESHTLSNQYSRACWHSGTLSTGYFALYPTVTTLPGSTNRVCQMTEGYVVLPSFSRPLNQLQLRFELFQSNDGDTMLLALVNQLYDTLTTAIVIDTFAYHTGVGLTDTSIVYRLNNLPVTDGHLVFMSPLGSTNQFIDNILVEAIPDCSPVEQCSVQGVTQTTATLMWTSLEGNLVPTGYVVEYGPRFFEPGTGLNVLASSAPFTLTSLNPGTDYDVYISTVCGTDTTVAFGPVRLSTQCDVVSQLPYTMSFEGIQRADYTAQTLPTCWYAEPMGSGTTPALAFATDSSQASSGNSVLQFRGAGIVALPQFLESLSDLKVQFHLYRNQPGTSTIIVGVVDSTDPGFSASFTPIDTIPYSIDAQELQATVYLSDYSGTGGRIALRAIGVSYTNQYIDDIVVDNVTECIPPQHVTLTGRSSTSATLAWRVSQAPNYNVEYGLQGFQPGTGTLASTSSPSDTLSGLLPGSTYDVYVKGICSPGDESESTLFSFSTLRGAPVTSYPYQCSFSDSTENSAWQLDNGGQTNQWHIGSAASDDSSSANMALYISDDQGLTHHYYRNQITHGYAYRPLTMLNTSYRIHYDWMAKGESTYDFMRVFLVPANCLFTPGYNPNGSTGTSALSNGAPQGWTALDGGTHLSNSTSWQSVDLEFDIPAPGDYYLLCYWLNDGSGGTQPPAAVDNITISLSGCPAAQGLEATEVTTTTVRLAWESQPLAEHYLLEYGASGFEPGSGIVVSASGNSYTIEGLAPSTAYDFYLTTACGEQWYADSATSLMNVSTLDMTYYTVTLLVNNAQYGTVEGGGEYEAGSVATLTATPAASCHFMTWDDGNTDNPRYYTVDADVTLTAIFAADSVGIHPADNASAHFHLYPNPTSEKVTIMSDGPASIVVMDIAGREMLKATLSQGLSTIDLSSLAEGTYFVHLTNATGCAVQKLIKR
jgi:hypothetical protein